MSIEPSVHSAPAPPPANAASPAEPQPREASPTEQLPPDAPPAEPAPRRKDRKNTAFWRACRYLAPYRRIVIVSIVCAFCVGFITTIGLTAMLPILRVLLNGDTLQGYVDRQIVQHRLGVSLDERAPKIARLGDDSAAARSGLEIGDDVAPLEAIAASPAAVDRTLATRHGEVRLALPAMKWHWSAAWGTLRQIVQQLPTDPVKAIAACYLIVFGLALVGSTVRFFQEYLSDTAAISAINDIRRHLYDHVLHTPLNFFNVRGTSDVTSRLVGDSQQLQDGFKTVLGQSIQEPLKAMFFFGLAMALSWRLTLVIVVFAPIMAAAIRKFGKKMRRASRAAMQRSSDMLGQIEGTLIGIRVVKAATAERFERRRYGGIMKRLREEQLKMARYEAWATPTMETVAMLVIGVVLIFAAQQVLVSKSLDSAKFILIFGCLVGMGESLRRVSKVNSVLQRSNAAAQRIFEIIDLPMERRRLRQAEAKGRKQVKLPPLRREIAFENVTFSYPNAQRPAVDDVSLTVAKGQSIAIVGRNGSGKTTLLALLPRFYDPQFGRVTIDGVDVRDATLRSVRRQIGIVTQDSVIFPGTIAENIAYGLPNTPRAAIEDAARRAYCEEFILQKPNGYDTLLDGLGGQLSGGQKQRLNIARAILRAAPILVLDEATSQVDAESEHLIQKAVESIMGNERTTFVIAHRFSTILSADSIVVMDQGRIVGQGKHDDLLRTCATYKQLYERQLFAA
ncbi:MAG TPA: ABC transporter ATP-binding protein [Tepidisphaeraceae bacterium]|nr:ABC transporter ATP-binding protein [Tepidisphaeraceae bacterium]